MNYFFKLLLLQIGFDVVQMMFEYFDCYYWIFCEVVVEVKMLFECGDWYGLQWFVCEWIMLYDDCVKECVEVLEDEYDVENIDDEVWQQIKLYYIGLFMLYCQFECVEIFFNLVCCKILYCLYFSNDFIFVCLVILIEYLENDELVVKLIYCVYYLGIDGFVVMFECIVMNFQFELVFEDFMCDIGCVMQVIDDEFGYFDVVLNFQIYVLLLLFFCNKSVYIIGCIINVDCVLLFVVLICYVCLGLFVFDIVLLCCDLLQIIFSFLYLYFFVDMGVLFVYVEFFCMIMLGKLKVEIYMLVGLQKQGKNLFYCDLLYYLLYLSDCFIIVFGIKGFVMFVFMLLLFLYVFKIIKDYFLLLKEMMCVQIMEKYQFVKCYDCFGWMVDMFEYLSVVLLFVWFDYVFVCEFEKEVLLLFEYEDDKLVIKYLYIECWMMLFNLYLQNGSDVDVEYGVKEYGNVVKELMKVNIFFGDMLYKNFGVMCYGCVVFYDYDEIEYLIDCNVWCVLLLCNEEDELFGELWYIVGLYDIFLEIYGLFLFGDLCVCSVFMKYYVDFFDFVLWQVSKDKLMQGELFDFYLYDVILCFCVCYFVCFGVMGCNDGEGDVQCVV